MESQSTAMYCCVCISKAIRAVCVANVKELYVKLYVVSRGTFSRRSLFAKVPISWSCRNKH